MGFSRQEYWSGLPCPPPGDLPDPGIELESPSLAGGFFTAEPPVKPSPCYRAPHYSQDSMAVSAGLDIGGTHGSPIECAPTPKIPGSARPQFRLPEPLGGGVDSGGEKLEEGPRFFFEERIQQRDQDCEKDKSVY